jgi:heme/copper-type cytochrome/quinol oxidase subunit 2
MNWLIEHSMWVLLGLILFMAVWFVAFFARNAQAKREQDSQLDRDTKAEDTTPLKKSDKV